MILYKYYGYKAGLAALASQKLGFRNPENFNDPFELLCFPDKDVDDIKASVGILSLTKNPLNALMWSHYGENHQGFVIGYDVSCDFLNNDDFNIISAANGHVRYESAKSNSDVTDSDIHDFKMYVMGLEQKQDWALPKHRLLEKLFLTKSSVWSYEEEVRVVKALTSFSETQEEFFRKPYNRHRDISNRVAPGQSFSVVPGLYIFDTGVSIKEVYLGLRNPLVTRTKIDAGHCDYRLSETAQAQDWKIFECSIDEQTWNLKKALRQAQVLNIGPNGRRLKTDVSLSVGEFLAAQRILSNPLYSFKESDQIKITTVDDEVNVQWNGVFLP